jgi:hypothetical protein
VTASRFTLAILLVVSAALLGAQQQRPASDWDDLYREAKRHIERREWKIAEEKLVASVKTGPPSGPGAIRRMMGRDEDYFPEYYLGIVYLNTGRAAPAVTQFQVARKRGINPKDSEFRQLAALEARAATLVEAEAPKRPVGPEPKQQFKVLFDQSLRALGEARYDDAEAAAKQARALKVDDAAIDGLLEKVNTARASARLQQELARGPGLAELRRLLTEYESTGASLDEVRRRIAAAEGVEIRTAAERAAMLAFFEGNYQRSVSTLADAEKKTALSPRGHFYRACSLASLATRGKVTNQAQLREARRQYAIAAQNAAEFDRDLKFISPRLLELLRAAQ